MRTHTGEVITGTRLQEARIHAAKTNRAYARAISNNAIPFADHVSPQQREQTRLQQLQTARDIEAGKLDHNFTIWQRMDAFLTGTSVPLLPQYPR